MTLFSRLIDEHSLAALPSDDGEAALGIIQGPAVYVLRPSGLALVNRLHIEKAFRV